MIIAELMKDKRKSKESQKKKIAPGVKWMIIDN
jgi:hypothetical protein